MKTKKRLVLLALAALATVSSTSAWSALAIKRDYIIPIPQGIPQNPRIDGEWVAAYLAPLGGSGGVYVYNIEAKAGYIVFNGHPSGDVVEVGGGCVVWGTDKNGNQSFFKQLGLPDPRQGRSGVIVLNLNTWQNWSPEGGQGDRGPNTDGKRLVWEGPSEICVTEIGSGGRGKLSLPISPQRRNPQVAGNLLVWQQLEGNRWKIWGYRLSGAQAFPINGETETGGMPRTDGNMVVWQGDGVDIYDVRSGRRSKIAKGFSPDVDAGIVVFCREVKQIGSTSEPRLPTKYELVASDLSAKQEVVFAKDVKSQRPSISDGRVVWVYDGRIHCAELENENQSVVQVNH